MNPLEKYLDRHAIKQSEFAERLGKIRGWPAQQSAVSMWVTGRRSPSMATRVAIAEATGGEVSVKSWDRRRRRSA